MDAFIPVTHPDGCYLLDPLFQYGQLMSVGAIVNVDRALLMNVVKITLTHKTPLPILKSVKSKFVSF